MAENFLKPVDGAIYLGGTLQARVNSYSHNMSAPTEDVTDFGSDGPEFEYTGLVGHSGSLTGQMLRSDTATTQPMQTIMEMFSDTGTLAPVLAKFIESTKSMWYGNIKITNISMNHNSQALQSFSADWQQSAGRLSWTSSTSTST